MAEVLVTGGTGALGSRLVPRLVAKGYSVRVLSRRSNPSVPAGAVAVRGDLTTRTGVAEATEGADVIVHCATGAADSGVRGLGYRATKRTDVEPTKALLDIAGSSGGPHFVYISIVGIDKIPLGYYRGKLDCERAIIASGLPNTILRTTQWHTLAWEFCQRFSRSPVMALLKGLKFQLLDPDEVAERMAELVDAGPAGRVADMGGPHVLDFRDIARAYLSATRKRRIVASLPLPGRTVAAFRAGHNLAPDHADGRVTWDEWLSRHVATAT
jgi:uncharacterized protein YbjT (DUF2867 family)